MLQCHEQLSSGVCGVGRLRLLGAVCVAGAGQGGQQLPAHLAACTGVPRGVHVCVHAHLSPLGGLGWAQLSCSHAVVQGGCAEEDSPCIPLSLHPFSLSLTEDEQHKQGLERCCGRVQGPPRCLLLGPSLSRHFPRFLPVPCFVCSQSVSFVSVFAKAIRSLPLRCQPARTTAIVSLSDPGKQESSGSGTRRGAARASLLGEVGQGMEPFPAIQLAS
uniref:Uncharacterized protein n=1 Tax=Zonotrichia albicollis TaxID=44394 RepID=A0A8D2N380_ZONAL